MKLFNKTRILALLLTFALTISVIPGFAVAASKDIKVQLDGKQIAFDTKPQISNGSTLVPYRALAEKLKATVKYDSKTNKVSVVKGSKTVVLTIGSTNATINGKAVKLDAAPITKNGSTLVPLRFLGESLGV